MCKRPCRSSKTRSDDVSPSFMDSVDESSSSSSSSDEDEYELLFLSEPISLVSEGKVNYVKNCGNICTLAMLCVLEFCS